MLKKVSTVFTVTIVSIIILSIYPGSSFADTMVFQDDFESYTLGDPPAGGWVERYWTGSKVVSRSEAASLGATISLVDTVSSSGNQSVHFSDENTQVAGLIGVSFQPTIWLQLDYDMMSGNQNHEGAGLRLDGDVGDDYMVGFSNGSHNGTAGYIGIHGGTLGWIVPELLEYRENTWYHVQRQLNLATNEGYFKVWEVSDPSKSGRYEIGSEFSNTFIDHMTVGEPLTTGSDGFIDDINLVSLTDPIIPAVPEPATMLLLGSGLVGLAGFRKKLRKR